MDPRTGEVFDLASLEDARRAVKAFVVGEIEALVQVKAEEIERLQAMSRQQRRAELRKRPRVERETIEKMLREAEKTQR
jgi:hypothetical protein